MKMACKDHIDARKFSEHATSEDFCKVFTEDVAGLYQLSFVLTANPEKAEQCFVAGLEDCVDGTSVYKQWARSWARRRIIQNSIRIVAPAAHRTNDVLNLWPRSEENPSLAALLELGTFERFVFVMSVLEGHSDQECSILLGCSRGEVAKARGQALRKLSKLEAAPDPLFADTPYHFVTKSQTF
jgi:hypothetical protein